MPKSIRAILCLCLPALGAYGQSSPVAAQFERLMGQPKDLVNDLVNFPWKADLPGDLPGLRQASTGGSIRIASAQQPIREHSMWRRWESEDGALWVDLITFPRPYDASETLRASGQPHSGYQWANQILLFSGTGDQRKEAVGAALIAGNGMLLNIGLKLPLEVHWDRPLPEPDRVAFDAALTRFQSTLDAIARAFLDPAYVSLDSKIEPKPGALSMLRIGGFARLWSYIKYNFVYLDKRPDLNWDGILEQYLPKIAAAKDDAEYGRILQRVVALLHDGHTNVYPNAADPHDAPPILLEPVGGKPVATSVGALPELSAIRAGMELTEIDGTPVQTIIERDLDPYISSGTIQDRQLRQMRMLLQGPPGSQVRTKWLTTDGKTVEAALTRDGSKHRGALTMPNHPRLEYRDLSGIAYIGLNDFSDPKIDAEFDAKYDQLRSSKAWIIDLRWNGGGSSEIGYHILANLIEAPAEASRERSHLYNPTLEARGQPQPWYEWPSDKISPAAGPHYQGPVYVLTSPNTCSAAEDFLIPLKMAKRITIVGEPTCGSTGQPLPFSIYGATARVCTKWDQFPDGTEFVGVGVVPDVKAAQTKEDVRTGRDAVLETAIRLASGNR